MRRPRHPRRQVRPPPGLTPELAAELATYANQFEVGYNAFEFLFDFAQDYADSSGEPEASAHTRIVTAPAYAKVFLDLLDRSIVDYEAQFGAIALPAPAVAPVVVSVEPAVDDEAAKGKEAE